MRGFLHRLWSTFRRARSEQELVREISSHLRLIEDEYRRRGLSYEEAYRAARLALGGVEQTKELHREARSFASIDDLKRCTLCAAYARQVSGLYFRSHLDPRYRYWRKHSHVHRAQWSCLETVGISG